MRVPLLNFEGGPEVLLLNFSGVPVPLLHHAISIDIVIMIKSSELTLGFAVLFVILEGLKHRKLLTSQF